ncbi:MAG: hypothetical protein F4Z57_19265 [Gemmatimonadetes bacterium]|nr:hypothetical protein [Gemmatimonadota bacterium]MXW81081.1 hypothetical protein [Gemmatimonadota bacterium]
MIGTSRQVLFPARDELVDVHRRHFLKAVRGGFLALETGDEVWLVHLKEPVELGETLDIVAR